MKAQRNARKTSVTIQQSVHIKASPNEVWDYTQDWSLRSQWDPAIRKAVVLQTQPALIVHATGFGSSFNVHYKQLRRPDHTSLKMVDCNPTWMGGEGAWAYRLPGGGFSVLDFIASSEGFVLKGIHR